MQRRDRLIAAVLIVLVFVASTIAYGASVNDPAWEKIVGAGKKEGKVVVFGPPGADVRDAYTLGFQKKYPEIEVDLNGMMDGDGRCSQDEAKNQSVFTAHRFWNAFLRFCRFQDGLCRGSMVGSAAPPVIGLTYSRITPS